MATPKKQSTTKSPVSSMGLTFESGNPDNYPIAYVDNVWDIAAANSQLALKLGNSGQFDQHTINEDLATAARTNAAAIETLNKTDGSAGSVKKIVDDAIAAVVAEAPAAFDTLKEMSDWIAQHVEDASAMNTAIQGKVDKVNGKGLSENDYTDTEKSKLANIEAGAQVNDIEHIKVNNTEQTITDKTVNITLPTAANEYVYICKNYSAGTSTTILAATHGCGATPLVICWLNNKVIELDVTKNAAGDITIGWNGTTTISAQNPLTICVMGMSVTPDEEQQPAPAVPDASDYPYLTFTKTGTGECSVIANTEETFAETSVDIPAAVMLNGEELSVTSIGDYAFDGCSDLTSVTIPGSVTSIGDFAFDSCSNLTSVTIPGSVTSIGEGVFEYCSSLESVTILSSVTSISDSAFEGCTGLTSIIIPNSVTSIGDFAFNDCPSLESVTIPNSVTSIGNSAFEGCTGLTSIIIPNLVTSIGNSVFANCSNLESVTIPSSVTSIGDFAFANCSNLESVTIPNSVTSIGDEAFENCSNLTSITIPDSVTSIGDYAFNSCGFTSLNIPDTVTSIGDSAFGSCTAMETLTIGSGVVDFAHNAFEDCGGLITINVNSNIPQGAFGTSTELTSVTIGDNVTIIGNNAFEYCDALEILTIGSSVESIGDYAFVGCTSLQTLTIGSGVEFIGESAFSGCGATELVIPSSVETIDEHAFYNINPNCTIYCEADSQPVGWDSDWTDCENVVWGYEPETIEENCPECGQPMWGGECTNTSCPNSPYYDQGAK